MKNVLFEHNKIKLCYKLHFMGNKRKIRQHILKMQ
jgi:hypothetical protein